MHSYSAGGPGLMRHFIKLRVPPVPRKGPGAPSARFGNPTRDRGHPPIQATGLLTFALAGFTLPLNTPAFLWTYGPPAVTTSSREKSLVEHRATWIWFEVDRKK